MSRFHWIWAQLTRRLWFRAALFSLGGVATALLAILLRPLIPPDLGARIGAEAVDTILHIMASSMLAVTTFSLGAMVSAYAAAASGVSPRATTLLLEDTKAQNALSAFLGAFLFSIVGVIALSTGLYGQQGRVVLFVVTLAVIAFVVVTLLRWIDYLSRLGRTGETIARVEEAALQALRDRAERPHLGGTAPAAAMQLEHPVAAAEIGYLCHIDMRALEALAATLKTRLHVTCLPGAFVTPSSVLMRAERRLSDDQLAQARTAFAIREARSFDFDPRFGLSVMSEIGSRALSPAVNDPGTAIDVIGRGVRILSAWSARRGQAEPEFAHVAAPALSTRDLFEDFFAPLARDGATAPQVMVRILKGLSALAACGDAEMAAEARRQARLVRDRAMAALDFPADRDAVAAASCWLDEGER
jgi:uncharacterized membrane protein